MCDQGPYVACKSEIFPLWFIAEKFYVCFTVYSKCVGRLLKHK